MVAAARALFAAEGVDVPLDAVARRAGVGAGTVHRHFATKEALLAEVVVGDLERLVARSRELPAANPGEALLAVLGALLDDGLANAAVKAALAETGFSVASVRPDLAAALRELLAELLAAAQRAGAVRHDVDAGELRAVLVAALSAQAAVVPERARHVRGVVLDGLLPRPRRTSAPGAS